MKNILAVILLYALCSLPCPTWAVDYYVATTGNDSSAGTQAQPWRTLAHAVSVMQGGDTTYVHAGSYAPVTMARSGASASAMISLVAFPGETPIVEGAGNPGGGEIDLNNTTNIRISGFELRNSPDGFGLATWDTSPGGTIIFENNHIHHNVAVDNAAGISLTRILGTVIMRNNLIHDNDGTNPNNCHGIVIFGDSNGFKDIRAQNNELYNEGVPIKYKHPSLGGTSTFDASYNMIHDTYGRIGIESTEPVSHIHHNVLYNLTVALGMFGDSPSPTHAEIDHNSVFNGTWAIRVLQGYTGVNIHDNILVVHNVGTEFVEDMGIGLWLEQTDTTVSDYNMFTPGFAVAAWDGYNGSRIDLPGLQAHGLDAHSLVAIPGYVNAPSDMHLQANSPARLRGSNGHDMGAYELGTEVIGINNGGVTPPPPPPPPASFLRCDIDRNGSTTVTDVQQSANQAVGIAACLPAAQNGTADINSDGQCDVIDVQRVVNNALGGQCVTP